MVFVRWRNGYCCGCCTFCGRIKPTISNTLLGLVSVQGRNRRHHFVDFTHPKKSCDSIGIGWESIGINFIATTTNSRGPSATPNQCQWRGVDRQTYPSPYCTHPSNPLPPVQAASPFSLPIRSELLVAPCNENGSVPTGSGAVAWCQPSWLPKDSVDCGRWDHSGQGIWGHLVFGGMLVGGHSVGKLTIWGTSRTPNRAGL